MSEIKFYLGEDIPLEMHKARIVQKLRLIPIEERLEAIKKAGNNTFLLKNRDVFLDMLTDSGVNAMSDNQLAAMMRADDSYAGSETYYRLEEKVLKFFNKKYFLPAHQGRACENIISKTFIKNNAVCLTNYHFTTAKAHILANGGSVVEIIKAEGLKPTSNELFKGDIDLEQLNIEIKQIGVDKIAFLRIELGTNLIGGQPVSVTNIEEVYKICQKHNIMTVLDASLLADNLYFNKVRENSCKNLSIKEINDRISACGDIIYFSARKLGCAKGGGIVTNNVNYYNKMRELVPLFEGFLTYGGMSLREMEAVTVGLDETLDFEVINQTPIFVKKMVELLQEHKIPVVTPAGGLGVHLNAKEFCSHLPREEYQAASLASALYLISGIRGMERGTLSESRKEDGSETFANMELLRLALPKRVYTLSHIKYAVDRIVWLYSNRHLIGGLKFKIEPKIMRFFLGELEESNQWQIKLIQKFKEDFGENL